MRHTRLVKGAIRWPVVFFLIISSVDRDMITKTVTFSIVEDFGFSMSPRDLYYQFHKNAPGFRMRNGQR